MQVGILQIFLLLSSSLLFSTVLSDPNHHHNKHDDFSWQNLLSSLGIVFENQTYISSNTEEHGGATVGYKEHSTSESTVDILQSETTDETLHKVAVQNVPRHVISGNDNNEIRGLSLGYKIGIPVASILIFIGYWYCICRCFCACRKAESPNVVVMQQSNTVQPQQPAPAPQIILQQPIIHQPPVYEASQRWGQPPPQGPPQWGQPPQGPQWVPHPMGQQQHYSPNSGYDTDGYNSASAPPPYNTGKY